MGLRVECHRGVFVLVYSKYDEQQHGRMKFMVLMSRPFLSINAACEGRKECKLVAKDPSSWHCSKRMGSFNTPSDQIVMCISSVMLRATPKRRTCNYQGLYLQERTST